jgi:glycine dehydrogenase subunit 1
VEPLTGPTATFREFAVRLPLPARVAVERLADEGFLAGVALEDLVGEGGDGSVSEDGATHGLLVAVTERRTRDEIDRFVAALDKAVR